MLSSLLEVASTPPLVKAERPNHFKAMVKFHGDFAEIFAHIPDLKYHYIKNAKRDIKHPDPMHRDMIGFG